MLATRNDIIKYIPQRSPIVMVHNLIEAKEDYVLTQFKIESNNVFLHEGSLAEPGLVENIAQTAAVHIGYQCSMKGVPIPVGYIAAIKELKFFELPKEGTIVNTSVRITNKVLDVTIIQGKIEQAGRILCSCEMRIFAKLQSL